MPDNVHWDPAYTAQEVAAVMQPASPETVPAPGDPETVMDDHGVIGQS